MKETPVFVRDSWEVVPFCLICATPPFGLEDRRFALRSQHSQCMSDLLRSFPWRTATYQEAIVGATAAKSFQRFVTPPTHDVLTLAPCTVHRESTNGIDGKLNTNHIMSW